MRPRKSPVSSQPAAPAPASSKQKKPAQKKAAQKPTKKPASARSSRSQSPSVPAAPPPAPAAPRAEPAPSPVKAAAAPPPTPVRASVPAAPSVPPSVSVPKPAAAPVAPSSPPATAKPVEKPRAREHGLGVLGQRAFAAPAKLVLLSKLAQTAPEALGRATRSSRTAAVGERGLPAGGSTVDRLGSATLAAVEAELRAILDLVAEPPAPLPAEPAAD